MLRLEEAKLAAELLRVEYDIFTPYAPVRKLALEFSKLYHFYNWQSPDFKYEAGFSTYEPGTYRIYINADLPTGRDSFTLAHELGHIVMGHHRRFNCHALTGKEHQLIDREADVFAANLLMPEKWMRWLCEGPLNNRQILYKLKMAFKVSWAALIFRLDELGYQEKSVSYGLFKQSV